MDIKICVSIKTFEKHTFNEMLKYIDQALWKSEKFRDVLIYDFEDLSPDAQNEEKEVKTKCDGLVEQMKTYYDAELTPDSSEAFLDPSQKSD